MGTCCRKVAFWVLALLSCIGLSISTVRAATPIAILMSDSLKSSKRTAYGAQKVIKRNYQDISFTTFFVPSDDTDKQVIIDSIKGLHPKLLITVGSPATKVAKDFIDGMPIVFAAVRHPELSGFVKSIRRPGDNITGASLDIPVHIQFKYFKKIIPNLRQMGVLYSDLTASLIPPAEIVAKQMGITLIPIRINGNKDVPRALDSLKGIVEGIWTVPDPKLFDPQTTRYILLNALRKGIPLMGFSRNVVESGALFALDFDYKAVGAQAGEIACEILKGKAPGNIQVSAVDVIWFHYNEKTARHINIKIPDDLVAIAKEVYR